MATTKRKQYPRPRRRKRFPLDEALRRQGLDEVGFAENLDGFFHQLEGEADVPKMKLMLEGLKELGRHLEGKRPGTESSAGDAPVTVQLVHNVDRPARPEPQEDHDAPAGSEPQQRITTF